MSDFGCTISDVNLLSPNPNLKFEISNPKSEISKNSKSQIRNPKYPKIRNLKSEIRNKKTPLHKSRERLDMNVGFRMYDFGYVGFRMYDFEYIGFRMYDFEYVGFRMYDFGCKLIIPKSEISNSKSDISVNPKSQIRNPKYPEIRNPKLFTLDLEIYFNLNFPVQPDNGLVIAYFLYLVFGEGDVLAVNVKTFFLEPFSNLDGIH
jgi:hypothetical protein